ncbi:hypothetical protein BDZ45DRAFT_749573 [Acephala macrosclerotiorum]|nr:hypothetical protein BDZ45DRAFT_749573 [Acephala macrosclerotiorum]
MVAHHELDFDAEYAKLKEMLSLFEDVIQKKKEVDEQTEIEINDMKDNIRLRKHGVVAFNPEWSRRNSMPNTDLEREDIPAMQLLIEGTKEKVALHEEKLSIAQQSLECKDLEKKLKSQSSVLKEE